jgi:hypothetical protein
VLDAGADDVANVRKGLRNSAAVAVVALEFGVGLVESQSHFHLHWKCFVENMLKGWPINNLE